MAKINTVKQPRISMEKIKRLGGAAFEGLIQTQAPGIIRGFLEEYLSATSVVEITEMVQKKAVLWNNVSPERQEIAIRNMRRLGSLEWLTSEWVINAIKEKYPAIASLFLGWRKARNWLDHQIDILQQKTE